MTDRVRIGTRKSTLALWQARWVRDRLIEAQPDLDVELVHMDTAGDRDLATPLPSVADKGFFTAEIEQSLFDRSIDIAVHSLKDLPTELPAGLIIGAYCKRADAHDAYLGKGGVRLVDLPDGARIGTSSLRRVAQVGRLRPDIECVPVRGNLDTRWRKLSEDDSLSGIMLAAAGVTRMGWDDRITCLMDFDDVLPAPGQGVVAVECCADRADVRRTIAAIEDGPSARAARTERAFLAALEGGCQTPLGAFARIDGSAIDLDAGVFSPDGTDAVRVSCSGTDPEEVGRLAAAEVLDRGGRAILARIRR